jgi:hypothetical protein
MRLPPPAEAGGCCRRNTMIDQYWDSDTTGGTDINDGLDRLLISVLRVAVRDMRSLKATSRLFSPDGSIDYVALQQLSPERRGEFISAAGWVIEFVPATRISIPRGVVRLSRKVIEVERQSPFYLELFAAAIAGEPWRSEEMEGDAGRQKCIRCGKNSSWLPVLSTPKNMPPELTWRMCRPENHIPLCGACRQKLFRGDRDGKGCRSRKIDLAWSLWGNRFESYWDWYRAYENNGLPEDWDVIEYPLWPKEYGGNTWETGSGHVRDCAPRGPRGIIRSKNHQDALMCGLDESERDTPLFCVLH